MSESIPCSTAAETMVTSLLRAATEVERLADAVGEVSDGLAALDLGGPEQARAAMEQLRRARQAADAALAMLEETADRVIDAASRTSG